VQYKSSADTLSMNFATLRRPTPISHVLPRMQQDVAEKLDRLLEEAV
jgi:hypothetical protein